MSLRLTRASFLRAASAIGATALPLSTETRGEELFEVTDSETASIDGRKWDTPIVGGGTVDAVHRSVLLRFPGADDDIAILLRKGRLLVKAELKAGWNESKRQLTLLRLEYRPWERAFEISHALKAGQDAAAFARNFTVSGLAEAPSVILNGRPAEVWAAGQAFRIPLATP